jgi:membrane protein
MPMTAVVFIAARPHDFDGADLSTYAWRSYPRMNAMPPEHAPNNPEQASSQRAPRRWLPDRHTGGRTVRVVSASINSWLDHRAASKGAALSFYMLFSLAPILVLVISIAGLFFGAEAARGEIFAQIQDLVGAGRRRDRGHSGRHASRGRQRCGGSHCHRHPVRRRHQRVCRAQEQPGRHLAAPPPAGAGWQKLLRARLLSFSIVLVLAFMLLVSLIVNAALAVIDRFWGQLWTATWFAPVAEGISTLFSFAVVTALFAVIFKMLPNARIAWRDVMMGSVITALLFAVGKRLIGLYLGNSAVASSYGAAGSVVALMLWIYYSAQIFFFGAELTRQYALQFGSLRGHDPAQERETVK